MGFWDCKSVVERKAELSEVHSLYSSRIGGHRLERCDGTPIQRAEYCQNSFLFWHSGCSRLKKLHKGLGLGLYRGPFFLLGLRFLCTAPHSIELNAVDSGRPCPAFNLASEQRSLQDDIFFTYAMTIVRPPSAHNIPFACVNLV